MCVCVCVRERERERVYVYTHIHNIYIYLHSVAQLIRINVDFDDVGNERKHPVNTQMLKKNGGKKWK